MKSQLISLNRLPLQQFQIPVDLLPPVDRLDLHLLAEPNGAEEPNLVEDNRNAADAEDNPILPPSPTMMKPSTTIPSRLLYLSREHWNFLRSDKMKFRLLCMYLNLYMVRARTTLSPREMTPRLSFRLTNSWSRSSRSFCSSNKLSTNAAWKT